MKLAVVAYLPPPRVGNPQVFRENMDKFKSKYQTIYFSDHDYPDVIKIGNPEQFKDARFNNGQPNTFVVSNLLFFTAVRICLKLGITHMIYMEEDSRVGKEYWDDIIFAEYFNQKKPLICGGSIVAYNPCNYSAEATKRWSELVSSNKRKNYPVPTYGWKGAADNSGSCVFINGSIGVYDIQWMNRLFNINDTISMARQSTAWDMALGMAIWNQFKEESYDVVGYLKSMFSSYGNVMTTEEERMKLLRDGIFTAVHQVKSSATL